MEPSKSLLLKLARKYVWWLPPEQASKLPQRVVAQVMNIGTFEDIQELANATGEEYLRKILTHAEIGQFNERSWSYWHYRLDLAAPEAVPPMPVRRLA